MKKMLCTILVGIMMFGLLSIEVVGFAETHLDKDAIILEKGVFDIRDMMFVSDVEHTESDHAQHIQFFISDEIYEEEYEEYWYGFFTASGSISEAYSDLDGDGIDEYINLYLISETITEEDYSYLNNDWRISVYKKEENGYILINDFPINFSLDGKGNVSLLNSDAGIRIMVTNTYFWDGGTGGIYSTLYGYDGSSIYIDLMMYAGVGESSYIAYGPFDVDNEAAIVSALQSADYDQSGLIDLGLSVGEDCYFYWYDYERDGEVLIWDDNTDDEHYNPNAFMGFRIITEFARSRGVKADYNIDAVNYDDYSYEQCTFNVEYGNTILLAGAYAWDEVKEASYIDMTLHYENAPLIDVSDNAYQGSGDSIESQNGEGAGSTIEVTNNSTGRELTSDEATPLMLVPSIFSGTFDVNLDSVLSVSGAESNDVESLKRTYELHAITDDNGSLGTVAISNTQFIGYADSTGSFLVLFDAPALDEISTRIIARSSYKKSGGSYAPPMIALVMTIKTLSGEDSLLDWYMTAENGDEFHADYFDVLYGNESGIESLILTASDDLIEMAGQSEIIDSLKSNESSDDYSANGFDDGLNSKDATMISANGAGDLGTSSQPTDEETVYFIDGQSVLWGCGSNDHGQLGNNTTTESKVPIRIMENVRAVSAGSLHVLALKNDNTLWAWGYNRYGQIGDGTTLDCYEPKQIMSNVVDISANGWFSAAVCEDGTLWLWGSGWRGKLANGSDQDSLTPRFALEGVVDVELGEFTTFALKEDGSLWACGSGDNTLPNNSTSDHYDFTYMVSGVVEIKASAYHVLAIDGNCSLYAWGENDDGRIGIGEGQPDAHQPIRIADKVRSFSAGRYHSAYVTDDGELYAFGVGGSGQIGNGSNENVFTPIKVMEGISYVECGRRTTFACDENGIIWVFGNNDHGLYADGSTESSNVPVISGFTNIAMLAKSGSAEADETAETYSSGEYIYTLLENNTVEIQRYNGSSESLELPNVINGLAVTSIGELAFSSCSSLRQVILPDGLTSLNNRAFMGCYNLTQITLPNSLTNIGDEVFSGCTSLTVTVERDSIAKQYCLDNGLKYTYPDANDWLND